VKASFFSLFKRGKYYHRKPLILPGGRAAAAPEDEREHREIERFAVAAIAFCFEFDIDFQQHFWGRVCRMEADPKLDQWSVDIVPSDWCDLIIRNHSAKGDYVYATSIAVTTALNASAEIRLCARIARPTRHASRAIPMSTNPSSSDCNAPSSDAAFAESPCFVGLMRAILAR
jgi:hypothetical protein